jgi:hypothetical protein
MASEYWNVVDLLDELGLDEGWVQEFESADYYRPDFTDAGAPFRDIRDFQGTLSSAHPTCRSHEVACHATDPPPCPCPFTPHAAINRRATIHPAAD